MSDNKVDGASGGEAVESASEGEAPVTRAEYDALVARLDDNSEMIAHLQGMLQNAIRNGRIGGQVAGFGGKPGEVGQAMDESHEQKIAIRERLDAWKLLSTRKCWLLSGMRPAVCNLKREELQDLLKKTALVTPAVVSQMGTLSGFDVTTYVPRGAAPEADDVSLVEQFEILIDALMMVVGMGVHSTGGLERLAALRSAFATGVQTLREHGRLYHKAMQVPANRRWIVNLVNEDLGEWTSHLLDATLEAGNRWNSPPDVGDLPPVVVPTWDKLNSYINAGGLMNAETKASKKSPNVRPDKRTRTQDTPEAKPKMSCFGWANKKGCRFEDHCIYAHDPAKKWKPKETAANVGGSSREASQGGRAKSSGARGVGAVASAPASSGAGRWKGGNTSAFAAGADGSGGMIQQQGGQLLDAYQQYNLYAHNYGMGDPGQAYSHEPAETGRRFQRQPSQGSSWW